jgi:hypothetical protein
MLPLEFPERLLLEDGEEDVPALRGTLGLSPLDVEVSWLPLWSLLPLCPVQPALTLMLLAAAEPPAAAALAMAPKLSKHPSNNEVARMAIKPPRHKPSCPIVPETPFGYQCPGRRVRLS